MGYFKLLNKLFPASPDAILKKATDAEAAVARMAHVNTIVNDLSDLAKYDLDLDVTNTLAINTNKGIIDIFNLGDAPPPEGFQDYVFISLTNTPVLNLANKENLYVQLTPYYGAAADDEFVPYVLVTGAVDGLNLKVYNASPILAGANQGTGSFYLYYEIKTLA
jgi:hypothetical protein